MPNLSLSVTYMRALYICNLNLFFFSPANLFYVNLIIKPAREPTRVENIFLFYGGLCDQYKKSRDGKSQHVMKGLAASSWSFS